MTQQISEGDVGNERQERELAGLWRTLRQPPETRPADVNAAKRRVDDLLSAYEAFAADPNDTTYERAYTETVAALLAARSPVVEQQPPAFPYAWEIDNMRRDSGRGRSLVYHPDEADFYRRERPEYTVTPLYAAPVPVLEQQPRAWECQKCGAVEPWEHLGCEACGRSNRDRFGAPLYAGASGAQRLKVFTCNDHDGVWPVGSASVVVAENEAHARTMLDAALHVRALKTHTEEPYTLSEVSTDKPAAHVLLDGDY